MQVIDTIAGFRKALDAERAAGKTVGLVPTMGALHAGHASLDRRRGASATDVVAVTDLREPAAVRPERRPHEVPASARSRPRASPKAHGASYVFTSVRRGDVRADGTTVLTTVHVAGITDRMEGAVRPGHFDGVATVVAKLFNAAGACKAFFGEKDYQQLQVVRQLVHDLSFPVEIVGCPIVREADGLALSSRNVYLSAEDRARRHRAAPRARGAGRSPITSETPVAVITDIVNAEPRATPRLRRGRRHRSRSPSSRRCPIRHDPPSRQHRSIPLMRRHMMKSKIHRATVTDANLNYVGSISLDPRLMELADIVEWEQVAVARHRQRRALRDVRHRRQPRRDHAQRRRGSPRAPGRQGDRHHLRRLRGRGVRQLHPADRARGRAEPSRSPRRTRSRVAE